MLTDRGKTQIDGIPDIHFFGPSRLHQVLVVDLLGPSLGSLFAEHKRRFTLKTVAMLAKRMVRIYANPEILDLTCSSYVWFNLFTRKALCIEISSLKTFY